MEQVPRTDDIDAGYCLRFLREVRDVAFATVDEDGTIPVERTVHAPECVCGICGIAS